MATPSSRHHPLPEWPPEVKPSYRPTLIAAMIASAGIAIGSVGPWVGAAFFTTINGLDASWWGRTILMAGATAAAALVLLLFWGHTSFPPRWSVVPALLAAVLGVGCLSMSLPLLIKSLTAPQVELFGVTFGPRIEWGLWLLTVSSGVLAVTAAVAATHLSSAIDARWVQNWQLVAICTSLVIVFASSVYFALHWESKSEIYPIPSWPSFTRPYSP